MSLTPDLLRAWFKRLGALVRPGQAEQDLNDEMAFHLDREMQRGLEAGLSPAAARRAARLKFGATEQFKDEVRERRGIHWIETLYRDVRFAARGLLKSPGFALVTVSTLGLGIGSATVIFSLVDAVVLAPLPYHDPDRLVRIWETNPDGRDFSTSEPNYLDFRNQSRTLAPLGAYRFAGGGLTLTGRGEPRLVKVASATASLFSALGVSAGLGRTFSAAEDAPGGERVVVLGHRLWSQSFAGDSGVVGTDITLGGVLYTVIGVLPSSFTFLPADAWVALSPDPAQDRSDKWLGMVGRLAPGVTIAQAEADLAAVAAARGAVHPATAQWGVRLRPLDEWVVSRPIRRSSAVLLVAVAMLLLLASVNIATMLLARATARQRELDIRLALGAGRRRVVGQLLTESAVLAGTGGGLGLMLAYGAVAALRKAPVEIPRLDSVVINVRVLTVALLITVAVSFLVGLIPALQSTRTDLDAALRSAGRGGPSQGQTRLRGLLVVAQVALALVLLVGGGLTMRSLVLLDKADTGLLTTNVWAVPLQTTALADDGKVARFYDAVAERLEGIPGIRKVGATMVDPYSGTDLRNDVTPEERAASTGPNGFLQGSWRIVSPGYFEAAGVPVLQGRDFSNEDRRDGVPVALVSQSLANQLWPGQDPVGRRLYWGGVDGTPRTIIGVVGDVRDVTVTGESVPTLFLSTRQLAWPAMTLIVRTDGPVQGLADKVRAAVWAEDPSVPVPVVRSMREARFAVTAGPRVTTAVLAAFAAISLLLAATGLYGVLAFAVVERTREIGIRTALGASRGAVVSAVIGRGALLVGFGVGVGIPAAAALATLLGELLYETKRFDPLTFIAAPAMLAVIGLVASYLPARRAASVDPMLALRSD